MPTKKERDYYSLGFRDGMAYERDGSGLPTGRPMFSSDTYSDITSLKRSCLPTSLSEVWQSTLRAPSSSGGGWGLCMTHEGDLATRIVSSQSESVTWNM